MKYRNKIIQGNSKEILQQLPDKSVNMCITSPPYWALRDYGVDGQLGLESTFQEYIGKLCDIFDEVKKVLRDDGTCWVNMGDSYANSGGQDSMGGRLSINGKTKNYKKPSNKCKLPSKCLVQIPFRFSIEMTNRGWILRNVIIWHKPNAMPSSVKDRFTVDFEYLFFFSKKKKYYFEQQFEPIKKDTIRKTECEINLGKEKTTSKYYGSDLDANKRLNNKKQLNQYKTRGRNKRTVWKIPTKPFSKAHFAVYPEELIETPIKAGCPEDGIVLDPFFGAGTTGVVAKKQGKDYVGIDLNKEYCDMARERIKKTQKELF